LSYRVNAIVTRTHGSDDCFAQCQRRRARDRVGNEAAPDPLSRVVIYADSGTPT
jgi:alkylhydroperoxidase family enzyme